MGRWPLQDPFLADLCERGALVSIYLLSGYNLRGQIETFNQHAVVLKSIEERHVIFKRSISTITPLRVRA